MKSIIKNLWYRGVGLLYHNAVKYSKYRYYSHRQSSIEGKIRQKDVKKVVFFVMNVSMWKSNELFRLLMNDPEFEPYIVPYLLPNDTIEYRKENQREVGEYFTSKGFPYIDCYNFETNEWFNLKKFSPDIVFYAQPYNHGYKGLLLENVWKNTLFGYIPYCLNLEKEIAFYNKLYQNICWRLYTATETCKRLEGSVLYNKGKNIVVSGHPLFDEMDLVKPSTQSLWKQTDSSIKRIIWAPHHSILETDALSYSNFLDIAQDMVSILRKYNGSIQFAFKPHPRLKAKLYKHKDWGKPEFNLTVQQHHQV